uniref:Putative pilus assembly protein (FilD) n=1 Tax=mine drainage metagenome TaxID=410659 RepID=E6Q758_9ZZZZ
MKLKQFVPLSATPAAFSYTIPGNAILPASALVDAFL